MLKAQRLSGAARLVLALGLFGAAACSSAGAGSDGGPDPGAPDARPFCYPGGGTPTPGAVVELRTARDGVGLVAVNENEQVDVYAGPQGGFHFYLHARIRGLSPGDREQPPEANPATLFSLYLEDGTLISAVPCAYPLTYEVDDDGELALPYAPIVQIEAERVPAIYGQRVRIKVEVMDGEGRYATTEATIVAVPYDAPEPGDAGVPDAGAPDAGAPDAGAPDATVLAE
jgi:hypothetical protein